MATVIIGCKLPHGLTFKGSDGMPITLNGMNTSLVAGGYGLTHVNSDEAALFFANHADYDPVLNKAIFTHHSDDVRDVHAIAMEFEGIATGFEGLDPSKPAPGLKPDPKQALDDSKLVDKPPVRATPSRADKAATKQAAALAAGKQ
jgi:hypothetical protein